MLEIINLHAEIDGKPILNGLTLRAEMGKFHAIMGPNGSGKSTLSYLICGNDRATVTEGDILFNGVSVLGMAPEERAAAGLFLCFQYPQEIPGVPGLTFLKTAVNAVRKTRGEAELDTLGFSKKIKEKAGLLKISTDMLKRAVNTGFSGGEKKRNEILQALMLEPKFLILDELDSGLDIDALKIAAEGVNLLRTQGAGALIITHYQRLLEYIEPDCVHILVKGRIVKSGGKELALELEKSGYAEYETANAA